MNLGNLTIADLWLGSVQAKSAYIGNAQIWGGETPTPPTPTVDYFCLTAKQANSTVRLNKVGSPPTISLQYSTDGSTWSNYTWSGSTGQQISLAAVDDKVYFRAGNDNAKLANNADSNYNNFVLTGKLAVSGNIMTLLKGNGSQTELVAITNDNAFACLFDSCTALYDASGLILPSSTTANRCYANMFYGCSSFTTAPELPATTLAYQCYYYMFGDCTSLNAIKVAFTEWASANESTTGWVSNVAASGTFTCPSTLANLRGEKFIPSGWTKVNA